MLLCLIFVRYLRPYHIETNTLIYVERFSEFLSKTTFFVGMSALFGTVLIFSFLITKEKEEKGNYNSKRRLEKRVESITEERKTNKQKKGIQR